MTLWDEKPKLRYDSDGGVDVYDIEEMDTWLEKIKPYVDLALEVEKMFNEPLPPELIVKLYEGRENAAKRYKWLFEVIKKAKKCDSQTELIKSLSSDIDMLRDTLEAVKEWVDRYRGTYSVEYEYPWDEMEKIMEGGT